MGLSPSVRQSGEGPAYHGRITKQGRGQARGMLVEAAWAVARSPGPLRAFCQRVTSRRGKPITAVATARKLALIIWYMLTKGTDYIWMRPALLARKFRSIEVRAGLPTITIFLRSGPRSARASKRPNSTMLTSPRGGERSHALEK